jgi:uncharacterized protein YeaO (DUF488 family)
MLKIKRITDPPESTDGTRILVMRLWPRGIRRDRIDEWDRGLAPSRDLLFDFKRHGLPWDEYVKRYWQEIRPEALDALRRRARRETITLLCSCTDETHCHRGLLRDAIDRRKRSTQRHQGTQGRRTGEKTKRIIPETRERRGSGLSQAVLPTERSAAMAARKRLQSTAGGPVATSEGLGQHVVRKGIRFDLAKLPPEP